MRWIVSLVRLVARRARSTPALLFIRLLGTLLTVTLVCAVSLYSSAMGDAMLQSNLRRDTGSPYLAISVADSSLTPTAYLALDAYIRHQMARDLGLPVTDLRVHHNTAVMPVYLAAPPLKTQKHPLASPILDYYEGLAGQVDVIEGTLSVPARLPGGAIPIALSFSIARSLHVGVGTRLLISANGHTALGPSLTVAAIFVARDPNSEFWNINSGGSSYTSFVVPRLDDFLAVQSPSADFTPQFFWRVRVDLHTLGLGAAQHCLDALDRVNSRIAALAPAATLIDSLSLDITGFLYQYALLPFILYVLVAPIVAVILYAVAMLTALVIEQQSGEIVLMRSRGASRGQILGLYLLEGLFLGLIATLIGPLLGLPLARVIGQASGFLHFSGGLPFSLHLQAQTVLIAAVTAFITFLISLLPALAASRQTMSAFKQRQARRGQRPLWQRAFVDLILLALAFYGYSVLRQQGAIDSSNAQAALTHDPAIGLAPLAFALALVLLLARVLPWLAALALLVTPRFPAPLSVALQSIARAPRQPMRLVQLLALTLVLGVFAATLAGVVDANATDQVLYQAGSTIRLSNPLINYWQIQPVAWYLRLPGVHAASPVLRIESIGNAQNTTEDGSATVNMLGIDPATLPSVIWYRADFSGQSLHSLLDRLTSPTSPNAIVSETFLTDTGLHVGDTFAITTAKGRLVPGRVSGVASYFPTLNPTPYPFVVFNLRYLDMAADVHSPGEIWLKTDSSPQYLANLTRTIEVDLLVPVSDYEAVPPAFSAADDPLRAGIYGVASVGFLIALLLALLGFFVYTYLTLQRRAHEFGILRVLGLSSAQMRWLLLSEQFFLLGAAVGGGLIGGVLMSGLFLPYMPITTSIVPPFLVTIPWTAIAQFVTIIMIVFALVLTAHAWILLRLELARVLRLGDD